jgi:hypothetical protein
MRSILITRSMNNPVRIHLLMMIPAAIKFTIMENRSSLQKNTPMNKYRLLRSTLKSLEKMVMTMKRKVNLRRYPRQWNLALVNQKIQFQINLRPSRDQEVL